MAFQGLPLTLHQASRVTLLLSTAALQARPGERHAGGAVDYKEATKRVTESGRIFDHKEMKAGEPEGVGLMTWGSP